MQRLILYPVFIAVIAVTALSGQTVRDGYDWQLPGYVRETSNAGRAWCDTDFAVKWEKRYPIDAPSDHVYFVEFIYLVWADVHMGPGNFGWQLVDDWVAFIESVPHMGFAFFPAVFARMLQVDRGVFEGEPYMVPHWLETEGFRVSRFSDQSSKNK